MSAVWRSLAASLLLAIVLAGAFVAWGWTTFTSPGPAARAGAETTVLLEPGMGVAQIAARLESEGLISSRFVFRYGVVVSGKGAQLKAGEYRIPSGASMAEIMDILVLGRAIQYRLTVPEGLTTAMVMRLVAADPVLVGEMPEPPPEGAILPETYLFQRGTTRAELVKRMVDAKRALVVALWEERQPGLPITTKEEAIILASIVEKETGVADERPRVAAVFVNRLRRGMRLESDPTIIYGLTGGEPLGRGIRKSELERETPYNTYIIDGLPPTPIANPGRAALEAVLNPPQTSDLFFVADGTGGHAFAATYAEHQRNVARWREIERERERQRANAGSD